MRKTLKKVFKPGKTKGERKSTQPYDVKLKAKIINEYLRGEKSFRMLSNQYGIHSGVISRWVRVVRFGHPVSDKKIKITKFTAMSKKIQKTAEELREQNKLLRKQLEEEKLKALIYQKVIEIAEREYKLDITKKYAARRLVKSGK
jgi:transposase-like protein